MSEFGRIIDKIAQSTGAIDEIYPTKETIANIKSKLVNEDKLDMFFDDRFDFEIPKGIVDLITEALKKEINELTEETISLRNFNPFTFQYDNQYFGLEFLCNKDESVGISIKSRSKNELIKFLETYSSH